MTALDLFERKRIDIRAVSNLADEDAELFFRKLRWPQTDGEAVCPRCGCCETYDISTRRTFKCVACEHQFSVTSGTMFSSRKMAIRDYLMLAVIFCASHKGVPSTALSRTLGIDQKTAWATLGKFRAALARPDLKVRGVVQIDGCMIGGYRLVENMSRKDGEGFFKARYYRKKYDNRRIVVVCRESMGGATVSCVVKKESEGAAFLASRIEPGSVIMADEGKGWNGLDELFEVLRVKHKISFSANGVHVNMAESFFSLLRKMQSGTHHKISAKYLQTYLDELCWKQDNRHASHGELVKMLLSRCLTGQRSEAARDLERGAA